MPLSMEVGLNPGDFVLDGDPARSQKGAEPSRNFQPTSIVAKRCMDQDATWYGGRPRPTRHCVRWRPSPPPLKGHTQPSQFSANVRCGQTAGWTKMPIVMEIGLGPGDFVFDGDLATPRKKAHPPHPIFGPCLLWPNGLMDQNATWYGGKRRRRRRCVRWGRSSP